MTGIWQHQLDGETENQFERRMQFRKRYPGWDKTRNLLWSIVIIGVLVGCAVVWWPLTLVLLAWIVGGFGVMLVKGTFTSHRRSHGRPGHGALR